MRNAENRTRKSTVTTSFWPGSRFQQSDVSAAFISRQRSDECRVSTAYNNDIEVSGSHSKTSNCSQGEWIAILCYSVSLGIARCFESEQQRKTKPLLNICLVRCRKLPLITAFDSDRCKSDCATWRHTYGKLILGSVKRARWGAHTRDLTLAVRDKTDEHCFVSLLQDD